jgi:hypothetical protein
MLRFRHHFSIEPPRKQGLYEAKPGEFNNIDWVPQKRGLARAPGYHVRLAPTETLPIYPERARSFSPRDAGSAEIERR